MFRLKSISQNCVSFIPFLVFGHFWQQSYENMKILRNLCLILQGKMGKTEKSWKENHEGKVTKYQKPKDKNMGQIANWNK